MVLAGLEPATSWVRSSRPLTSKVPRLQRFMGERLDSRISPATVCTASCRGTSSWACCRRHRKEVRASISRCERDPVERSTNSSTPARLLRSSWPPGWPSRRSDQPAINVVVGAVEGVFGCSVRSFARPLLAPAPFVHSARGVPSSMPRIKRGRVREPRGRRARRASAARAPRACRAAASARPRLARP
jgi:hypothetical protein